MKITRRHFMQAVGSFVALPQLSVIGSQKDAPVVDATEFIENLQRDAGLCYGPKIDAGISIGWIKRVPCSKGEGYCELLRSDWLCGGNSKSVVVRMRKAPFWLEQNRDLYENPRLNKVIR